jgi:hypothetical protein
MPFYGQVWRQRTGPVLWVSVVHDESLLVARDLRRNPPPPVKRTNSDTDWDLLAPRVPDRAPEIIPPIYDSDELEDDDSDEESDNSCPEDDHDEESSTSRPEDDQGGFGGFDYGDYNDTTEESSEMARLEFEGQEKLTKLREYRETKLLPLAQALDDHGLHASLSIMPDPTPENLSDLTQWANEYIAKRQEREEMQAKALSFSNRVHHLIQAVDHALEYEPTHRHIHEIPDPTTAYSSTMLDWADNWFRIEEQGAVMDTWSPRRRGNMFA